MRFSTSLLFIGLAILQVSCEKKSLGPTDVSKDVPVLSNWTISPDTINVDNLTPSNGIYSVTASVSVKSTARENFSSQSVTGSIIRPNGSVLSQVVTLRDNGSAPDVRSGDSVYSATIQFTLTRGQTGRYRIQLSSRVPSGDISNLTDVALTLTRRNSSPSLSNVSTPDTVQLPTTDTIRVQFTTVVSDSDGIGDVREVFFYRISPPDPTKFTMKDDGGLDREISVGGIAVKSGDDIAGDGKYSFLIPLTSSNTRRTSVFGFQAIDSFGDTSATVQRTFTIR